ncbi:hypothetical protein Bca101_024016 [Brassica carinata]
MATKASGKSLSHPPQEKMMLFKDISRVPMKLSAIPTDPLREAWNPIKKTIIGLEMILIDEQGTVIQGFISPGRIDKYLSEMKPGSVYKLDNFYGTSNKTNYRVSEHAVTVSFSWNSKLSVLHDSTTPFDEDRFGFVLMRILQQTVI